MINISSERLLTLSQAAALLPGRPSIATLWRWRTKGVRGRRLESLVCGGKVFTSAEAIQRFCEQRGGLDVPNLRTPRQRERAIRQAETELESQGKSRHRGTK